MCELRAFWDKATLDCAPYVHPSDTIHQRHIQDDVSTYAAFVKALEDGMLRRKQFHLGLLPQPYQGDLKNAEILILLANPGLSACDYHVEQHYPAFREELVATIRQERRKHLFLDPTWAWTSGFIWWENKLRGVARIIASERFNGHYGRALADLSQRVAAIELVPYHSFEFNAPINLASASAARRYVASIDPGRIVIATRRVANWGLADGQNVFKYPASHSRGASLGPNTLGGMAILEHYGITVPKGEPGDCDGR